MKGADAGRPVVAEETVQDAGVVETGDDEATEVGDEGDGGGELVWGALVWGKGRAGGEARRARGNGVGALVGEGYVYEGAEGLDGG